MKRPAMLLPFFVHQIRSTVAALTDLASGETGGRRVGQRVDEELAELEAAVRNLVGQAFTHVAALDRVRAVLDDDRMTDPARNGSARALLSQLAFDDFAQAPHVVRWIDLGRKLVDPLVTLTLVAGNDSQREAYAGLLAELTGLLEEATGTTPHPEWEGPSRAEEIRRAGR